VKLRLVWVGKTQESWVRTGIEEYTGRVKRYSPFETTEIKEEKGALPEQMKQRESERIEKFLPKNGRLILLDELGEQYTSPGFAAMIGTYRDSGVPELVFAIGGAYGFSDELRRSADRIIALSKMTFTHQMVRPFFLEQLYRAFTILNNEGYHH
jgi:23S rRNA (pseudouridine1915-N3)-methyltransferase